MQNALFEKNVCVCALLVTQSCPLFATRWTVAHRAPLSMGLNLSGKNTGVGCHFLLQGIFLTQGSNLSLPHCRQILYHLSYEGSLTVVFKSH